MTLTHIATMSPATNSTNRLASKPYRKVVAKVPNTTTSILSFTSKMPSPSFSLPAKHACPFSVFGNGAVCDDCYADKGFYTLYPEVKAAQEKRYAWVRESLKTPEGCDAWVATMVNVIQRTRCNWFRWHDSGDIFSAAYGRLILRVCAALPDVRFWIPTRAWQNGNPVGLLPVLNESNGLLTVLRELAALPNVSVRPSALRIGDVPPSIDGLSAGTGVNARGVQACVAPSQNGECRDCRACWDKDVAVSYNLH